MCSLVCPLWAFLILVHAWCIYGPCYKCCRGCSFPNQPDFKHSRSELYPFADPDNALALCASSLSLSLCQNPTRPLAGIRSDALLPNSRPANTLKPFQNMRLADTTPPGDRAQEFDAATLSKLLSTYAALGVMPERLAAASAAELMRRLPGERVLPEDLVGLLWSLCLLQVRRRAAAGAAAALIKTLLPIS